MSARARPAFAAWWQRLLLSSLYFSHILSVGQIRAKLAKAVPAGDPQSNAVKQLLADVSVISQLDAGTGIQRVVRELLQQLIAHPPHGFEVRLISESPWLGYRYAESYHAKLVGKRYDSCRSGFVQVRNGDVFLGMDLATHSLPRRHRQLARWKMAGVRFCFLIYDLLPATHPEWFDAGSVKRYRNWIRTVSIFADYAACISQSVAAELEQWLKSAYGSSAISSLSITHFHLSGDLCNHGSDSNLHIEQQCHTNIPNKRPVVLMVGTIEPRKGYEQVISSFELLWKEGSDVSLAIVGREGWHVRELIHKIRAHPELHKRLVWLENATDETLIELYRTTSGLLMASEGEGFGLPIVEAARYGKPILARDIPVFREIAREHAQYFSSTDPTVLAGDIRNWLDLIRNGKAISSSDIGRLTWRESSQQLLRAISLDRELPAIDSESPRMGKAST